MGKLRSGRVKRTPVSGVTSDRYQFLGLEQAEPSIGDPLVGPSSVGSNPIPVGQVYQVVSVSNSEGKRYWTPLVGFGTTVGVISVYENGVLPGGSNKFQTIHGLNFVGTGVTIESPPIDGPFEGVGIATIRISVNEIKNQGDVSRVLYNTSSGLASGADDFVYEDINNFVGIGSTQPKVKLDVVGNSRITGVLTASQFIGNLTGTASTSVDVKGGIGSLTQLSVSGITTLGVVTASSVTASSFTGNLNGVSTKATNLELGSSGEIPYQVNSGVTSYISTTGANNKFLKYDGAKPVWAELSGSLSNIDVKSNTLNKNQYLLFTDNVGVTSELNVNTSKLVFNSDQSKLGIGTTNPTTTLHIEGVLGFDGSGKNNIKIGDQSVGSSITFGVQNIFIGLEAGSLTTEGSNNIFLGEYSGLSNTTGGFNNFIGRKAGYYNIDGSYNVFIGDLTGENNIDGTDNVFIGRKAGNYNASGGENTFIGPKSGFDNIAGNENTFVGSNSGYDNEGSYNVFLGNRSGFYNVDGNYNIGLGVWNYDEGSTSNSYKVIIGSGNSIGGQFDSPNTTKNTQLAIGVRTDSNPSKYWIVGDENFNVGIGTTNATSKLTVGGDVRITGILTANRIFSSIHGEFTGSSITASNIVGTSLSISGITTLGTVQISSGIVTSTVGIVTYYGDGSKLSQLTGATAGTYGNANNVPQITVDSTGRITGISQIGVIGGGGSGSGINVYDDLTSVGFSSYLNFRNNLSAVSIGDTIAIDCDVYWVNSASGIHTSVNVGIGTTIPRSKLDVVGNVLVSGISTFGTVRISSGIITSTSGNVIYYGDGSNLTGVTSKIGINKDGSPVGVGITLINFTGAGVSSIVANNTLGIATITIVSIGGGGITDSLWIQGNPSSVGIYTSVNVGVGTTSPRSKLDVVGNALISGITTTSVLNVGTSGTIITATSSGLVGIGTTNPSQKLQVQGSLRVTGGIYDSNNNIGIAGSILSSTGTGISWIPSPTGVGTTGGGVTISNNTSTNSTFYPVFSSSISGFTTSVGVSSSKLNFNPSTGNLFATQFISLSDESRKKNIETISNSIGFINQLNGVKFRWIDTNKVSFGLIAQEVEKIIPELVEEQSDGLKTINYSSIIAFLIEAIKQQDNRILELERKLNGE